MDLPTIPTILDGTRDVRDMKLIEGALGDLDRVVGYSRDPWVHAYHLSLTPEEGFVLSRVDGQASMTDILSITPLPDEEALRCLYTLVAGGFLEFGAKSRDLAPSKRSKAFFEMPIPVPGSRETLRSSAPSDISTEEQRTYDEIITKHASMERGTFYDWLEIARNAKDKDIRKAYLDLVKKYHPDRHGSAHLRELHGTLQNIIAKATQASERLSEPTSKRRYDQSLRSEAPKGEAMAPRVEKVEPLPPTAGEELAARYYREATKYVSEKRFHEAVKLLEEVVELDPSKSEYHRLLAQALSNNPQVAERRGESLPPSEEDRPLRRRVHRGAGRALRDRRDETTRQGDLLARPRARPRRCGAQDEASAPLLNQSLRVPWTRVFQR